MPRGYTARRAPARRHAEPLANDGVTVACAIRMELRDGAWRPILVQVV
jgi:hypothetical protein